MNRAQKRAAAKRNKAIHREALKRTKAYARKTAETPVRGEADAMALELVFDDAKRHPEGPLGVALAKMMKDLDVNLDDLD